MPAEKPKSGTLEYQRAWHVANKDRVNEQRRKYYKDNPTKWTEDNRARRIERVFGISMQEYDEGRARATCCEICGGGFTHKGPELDHCHTTGKVRGWLCGYCNKAIGMMKDSVETLQKAIIYLEKHG